MKINKLNYKINGKNINKIKIKGFILMKLLFAMTLISIVIALTSYTMNIKNLILKAELKTYLNEVTSKIFEYRLDSINRNATNNMFINKDGSILFIKDGVKEEIKNDNFKISYNGAYNASFIFRQDARLVNTDSGENGFTLKVYYKNTLVSSIIFRVNTSLWDVKYYL